MHAPERLLDDDGPLVLHALQGEKDAFSQLVQRHRPTLLAVCRRFVRDAELAEDAAQEAVLQALLSLDRLREPERFGSWLVGIGLNVCRRWLRGSSRDWWSWEAIHGGRELPLQSDVEPGPEEIAEAADLAERVQGAVAHLPTGQRTAVILFYLSGLTYAETASALGIDVGAVKTRLHKARNSLKKRLWSVWKEEEMPSQLETGAIQVRIADVKKAAVKDDATRHHILLLEEIGGPRRLRVWVGQFEGTAIALQLEKVDVPRPLTFTFTSRITKAAGARLREIRISRLAEDTFYAVAVIEGPQGVKSVDARPSDAIALALEDDAPIFVEPEVFAAAMEWEAGHAEPQKDGRWEEGAGAAEIVAEVKASWPGQHSESGKKQKRR